MAGLLQLPLPRSSSVPHIMPPNGSECSRKTDWDRKVGAYHTRSCIPSLAASTENAFENTSNGVQSPQRPGPILHLNPFTPPLSPEVPKIL